ncbi:MAG: LysR family transcriptional regulator [Deltaproteobacteria bacterium]|nr:MAG: LysR family transcriptional regulator [Deltaproteobacteria bacterium]
MKIGDMELLIRVAETGNMTLAAQQVHLTPAAVSAAVNRIETTLGVRLFERTTRSLHPTEEGLLVLESCHEVVGRWQSTLDELRGQRYEVEGTVQLAAPADTTYQILEALIVKVCTQHPKLQVVLNSSDVVLPIHRDAIDIAIRYGPLQDSSLLARQVVDTPGVLVASPSYLAEHGVPKIPQELENHRCLTLQISSIPKVSWLLQSNQDAHLITLDSPLCGDGYLARKWAIKGMGIAYKSLFDVIDDLEAGRLKRVLPKYTVGQMKIHIVSPSRSFLPARVKVLSEAIEAHFKERVERCNRWLKDNKET